MKYLWIPGIIFRKFIFLINWQWIEKKPSMAFISSEYFNSPRIFSYILLYSFNMVDIHRSIILMFYHLSIIEPLHRYTCEHNLSVMYTTGEHVSISNLWTEPAADGFSTSVKYTWKVCQLQERSLNTSVGWNLVNSAQQTVNSITSTRWWNNGMSRIFHIIIIAYLSWNDQ